MGLFSKKNNATVETLTAVNANDASNMNFANASVNQQTNASAMPQATQQVAPQINSTENREKIQRPMKGYRYTIINGIGKKETGTFDAESENDVRAFLTSLDYKVLEIKERDKFDIDIGVGKFGANDLSFSLTQLSTY